MSFSSKSYEVTMNFDWVEERRLAGCRGPRTRQDSSFLASQGIAKLVRLAYEEETGITSYDVEQSGMEDFYEPVKDFTAPQQGQIDRVVRFIRNSLQQGKSVAVSCGAGYGRTGTVLACYLVSVGYTADEAIEKLICIRPVSKEMLHVPGQRDAVFEFAHRLRLGEAII